MFLHNPPLPLTRTGQDRTQSHAPSGLDGSNALEKNKEGPDVEIAQDEQSESPPSPRNIHGFRWILAVVAVVSSILLYATDNTIVRPQQTFIVSYAPSRLTSPG